ncbi:hypothetical protein [Candidatus Regiella insecticola]
MQLENDRVVAKSAAYLAGKHKNSVLVQLDKKWLLPCRFW